MNTPDFRTLMLQHPFLRFIHEEGLPLVWVGGGVRDYLLFGEISADWDLATPEPAVSIARKLEEAGWGKIVQTSPLGTVKLRTPEGEVDIARFRREVYPEPGALPEVSFTESLEEDLWRRDFTVNAMAVPLYGPEAGKLVDPTGGLQDLERRIIRPLHARSFRDDPTRILRGIRYGVRLGFRFSSSFDRQARAWKHLLEQISFARVRREWMRIAVEARRMNMVYRIARRGLGVPPVHLPRTRLACVDRLAPREEEAWIWFFALVYRTAGRTPPDLSYITRRERRILAGVSFILTESPSPGNIARFLLKEDRETWPLWGCFLGLSHPESLREIPLPDGRTLIQEGVAPRAIPEVQTRILAEALRKFWKG